MEKHTETAPEVLKDAATPATPLKDKPAHWWVRHKRKLYWLAAGLAILLLIWLIWHKSISRMWHNLIDDDQTTQSKSATLEGGAALSGGTAGTAATRTTSTDGSKSTIGRDDSRTTTTTTSTTTTTPDNPSTPPGDDSGLLDLYANLGNGLTKLQITNLAGTGPTSCTDIALPLVGTQSVCTWTKDGQSVVATLLNGQVVSKAKIGF